MKPKGIKESKKADAEGKEDDKGAPQEDGMENHERVVLRLAVPKREGMEVEFV